MKFKEVQIRQFYYGGESAVETVKLPDLLWYRDRDIDRILNNDAYNYSTIIMKSDVNQEDNELLEDIEGYVTFMKDFGDYYFVYISNVIITGFDSYLPELILPETSILSFCNQNAGSLYGKFENVLLLKKYVGGGMIEAIAYERNVFSNDGYVSISRCAINITTYCFWHSGFRKVNADKVGDYVEAITAMLYGHEPKIDIDYLNKLDPNTCDLNEYIDFVKGRKVKYT